MAIIFILVPISLIFLIGAMIAFRFAVKSQQYQDLDSAANQIILDDRKQRRTSQHSSNDTEKYD